LFAESQALSKTSIPGSNKQAGTLIFEGRFFDDA
jgi:hypothetical protein